MYMSDAPAIAIATGIPVTISARNAASSVPVIACLAHRHIPQRCRPTPLRCPPSQRTRILARRSYKCVWCSRSPDDLLDRVLGPFEKTPAAPPVFDRHLHRTHRSRGESECADAVDDV